MHAPDCQRHIETGRRRCPCGNDNFPVFDDRVPGTGMNPRPLARELTRRQRKGLDLAGKPQYDFLVINRKSGIIHSSHRSHRGAARVARLWGGYVVKRDQVTVIEEGFYCTAARI